MGLALVLCRPSVCAQDVLPIGVEYMSAFGSDDLIGTARFIGMSGAMTAVGGDPSAVKLNPAGLGIYRHSQFSVTGAGQFKRFYPSIPAGICRKCRLCSLSRTPNDFQEW